MAGIQAAWRTGRNEVTDIEQETISVIVPVYKVEPYLRKCLDSIIGQSYRNLEIVLVDDGSLDNCGAICDEYAAKDGRIKVIHKTNGGVASARNAGLAAATGKWIGWVDPDDWIERDMYQYLMEKAQQCKAEMAVCGVREFFAGEVHLTTFEQECCLDRECLMGFFLSGKLHDGHCNKLYRRELLEGICFPDYRMAEDFAVMWRLVDRCRTAVVLPELKYNYCHRPGSIVFSPFFEKQLDVYHATKECYDALAPKWPKFEALMAERCVVSARQLWCGFGGCPRERRKAMADEMEEISRFCRPHIPKTVRKSGTGLAGQITLRTVAYPTGWSFALAGLVSTLYRKRHERAL